MGRMVWQIMKVVIMFVICLMLFFYGLRLMHNEYEQYHRYDLPEGPAIKVYQQSEESLLRHFYSFFR
ncbi:MAG TPA: DUF4227 family protein [Bacillota bacterium]|nr:DUF4227 family protein [Bacillota bacterium]